MMMVPHSKLVGRGRIRGEQNIIHKCESSRRFSSRHAWDRSRVTNGGIDDSHNRIVTARA